MRGGWRRGAGRPRAHGKTSDTLALDVRHLQREGCLNGSYILKPKHPDGARIELRTTPTNVKIMYSYKTISGSWHDVVQDVSIVRTPCRYGGERPWFACPQCSMRVALLFLSEAPACRKCAGLVYPVQSANIIWRSWLRTQKLEARLGIGAAHPNNHRPRRIRGVTMERLLAAYVREAEFRNKELKAFVGHLLGDPSIP